ncbi:MAG: cytochrome P460 [Acidobacteria bacterium]|nr:MAG: cytochrome P460 [Acidobacteriota bacterium]
MLSFVHSRCLSIPGTIWYVQSYPATITPSGRQQSMKRILLSSATIVMCLGFLQAAAPDPASDHPQYSSDNHLLRPENYREWIFLSSGFGMNYSPQPGSHEMFTNVFVPQWTYREFLNSGKWPDHTTFVVEERMEQSKGSINKHGHFQTDSMGIGVEVKDESRFPNKWAYFNFDEGDKSAAANPKQACWQCHEDHAAVEHSFVQFYPTLKPVAKKFGTYKQAAEDVK